MKKSFLIFASLLLLFVTHPAGAITLGQVDTFQDGTPSNWLNGFPDALVNISSGGPAGAGDRFMQLTADGDGSGGRLTTYNLSQWLGNYIAAGVTGLEIDLRNQGATSLSIRFAFKTDNLSNAPGYLTQAMILAPGSGWQHFSISLLPGSLTAVSGPPVYNTFFTTGMADFRIINEVGTSNLNGDFITGQLGFDNIRAVPEPTITALAVGGLALLGFRSHRRRAARS